MGSISVTITRAPWPRSDCAQPLPTSPYPHTTATLPASITSVARMMPSTSEWRQPYRLSNFDFVTESFTLMAGKSSVPAFCISYSRWTPVVVSSVTPAHARAPPQHDLQLLGLGGARIGHLARLLELGALVEEEGGVAAVVDDLRRPLAPAEVERALGAVPV